MTYVTSELVGKVRVPKSLWQRIHWERVALLGVNFAIWAGIVKLFI